MTEILLDLYRHHLWAGLRAIDYCEAQPAEMLDRKIAGTYGTPRQTLVHICVGEEGYAGRLRGAFYDDALVDESAFPGFDELRRRARRTGEVFFEAATITPPDRVFRIDDGKLDSSAGLFFVQPINHATEHRAQIVTTLSSLGAEPISLDAWDWGFETGALREPS